MEEFVQLLQAGTALLLAAAQLVLYLRIRDVTRLLGENTVATHGIPARTVNLLVNGSDPRLPENLRPAPPLP
jgi:hypothetical protein